MIRLSYNDESLEYDAYALLTSFYPGQGTEQQLCIADPCAADGMHLSRNEKGDVVISFHKGEAFPDDRTYSHAAEGNTEHDIKWTRKRFVYDVLADYSGLSLPWGGLTGVRPTKLILGSVTERGLDEDGLAAYMKEQYRVSDEKARLGYRIAMLEDKLLAPFRGGGYSLYIGIPFCPSTCLYCSFLSYSVKTFGKYVDEYLGCVERELSAMEEIMDGRAPDTVYIGGGTPTALSAGELSRLLDMIWRYVPIDKAAEFTVEAGRPDSLDREKLKIMKEAGCGRISVNPQTFRDETLKLIGRRHSVEQVVEAYGAAREAGFENINMDLILGLPGESLSDVEYTLKRVEELAPDSLTVHSLALKRAAKMREWVAEHGQISGLDHERAMKKALETAESLGMKPYYLYRQKNIAGALENTGFAKEGKYGLYNILIMEEVQSIYAIGAGTVSKKVFTDGSGRIERCDTHKDLSLYLSDIQAMIERKRKLFGEDK